MTQKRLPPGTIRLWSIQPLEVWEKLQAAGELYVDPSHSAFVENYVDCDFRDAYEWLREQMAKRTTGYGGRYPWWAYEHQPGMRNNRRTYGRRGEKLVRLELAVPCERVLLSAYGNWHYVLNRCFLHNNDTEVTAWEAELAFHGLREGNVLHPLPEPWRGRMVASWDRIFNVEELRATNTIQATFEQLALSDVLDARVFTSRVKPRS